MLDIRLIRENPEEVRKALLKRMDQVDFTELLDWDRQKKALIGDMEKLRAQRNKTSSKIAGMDKKSDEARKLMAEMKTVSARIKELETGISERDQKINDFLVILPNIPDKDVPAGGKENNVKIKEWGEKPVFDFEPKDHVELVTELNLIDYERGAKMGGSGFWLYKGLGSLIEWGLVNYFVEEHLKDGYEFILPPHLLNYDCGYTAGQFPKFEDDVFKLEAQGGGLLKLFLAPTAETALINFHRNETLQEDELPKKYFAYTPCYRKEAGSYRTNERGMIRGHQFNKVEMFQFTLPEESDQALEELIGKAERLVQGLGLHYQVSKLAAEDCSASMAKTYDIEVWIPSMEEYKEVSSASNGRDYQTRRGNIRFKRRAGKRTEYVHALNASGLATSRLLPAMVEQFQQKDGSFVVPEVLRKWVERETVSIDQ
ncbi:MAG: serine--tRNA ligase [Candidatus Adiutricales bacterium]